MSLSKDDERNSLLKIRHQVTELGDRALVVSIGLFGRANAFELFAKKHVLVI